MPTRPREGQGCGRHRDGRADGRHGHRADGGLRGPDRRGVRRLAAEGVRRRRLVNEPNSLCWNELLTRDVEPARRSTRPFSDGSGPAAVRRRAGELHGLGGRRRAGRRDDADDDGSSRRRSRRTGACASRSPTATPRSPRRASLARRSPSSRWTCRSAALPGSSTRRALRSRSCSRPRRMTRAQGRR